MGSTSLNTLTSHTKHGNPPAPVLCKLGFRAQHICICIGRNERYLLHVGCEYGAGILAVSAVQCSHEA